MWKSETDRVPHREEKCFECSNKNGINQPSELGDMQRPRMTYTDNYINNHVKIASILFFICLCDAIHKNIYANVLFC